MVRIFSIEYLERNSLQTVGDMPGQTSDERLPWIDDVVTRTALHLASRPPAHNFCHCRPFLEAFHVKHMFLVL